MNRKQQRIGFLYFEDIHHIPHFIGIASEISKNKNLDVEILTFKNKHEYLYRLIDLLDSTEAINVIELKRPFIRRIIDKITDRKKPSPVFLYKKHRNKLLTYDALVFTELNHKYIYKYRKGKTKPLLILANHGPAARGYLFQPSIKLFDFQLLHGDFYIERLKKENLIADNYAKVGYYKFDIVKTENIRLNLFKNDKPVVLYNPHFNKINSSWYEFGLQILEYFYNSDEYNLIFAPHIYLFNRKGFLKPKSIPEKFFNKNNIHIDLGSINSSNMSYSLNSDIYLGDVSSQVYEFQMKPRPCIFINVEKVNWQGKLNYRFWDTGHVIESVLELDNVLNSIMKNDNIFKQKQQEIFNENFYVNPNYTPSQLAAKAITNFLESQDEKR